MNCCKEMVQLDHKACFHALVLDHLLTTIHGPPLSKPLVVLLTLTSKVPLLPRLTPYFPLQHGQDHSSPPQTAPTPPPRGQPQMEETCKCLVEDLAHLKGFSISLEMKNEYFEKVLRFFQQKQVFSFELTLTMKEINR